MCVCVYIYIYMKHVRVGFANGLHFSGTDFEGNVTPRKLILNLSWHFSKDSYLHNFSQWKSYVIKGRFTHTIPFPCRPHAVSLPCHAAKGLEYVLPIWFTQCGRVWFTLAWGHGMASVNQTRPHYVNQIGKTYSKPLAAWHGRGTAWARHGNDMLCVNRPLHHRGTAVFWPLPCVGDPVSSQCRSYLSLIVFTSQLQSAVSLPNSRAQLAVALPSECLWRSSPTWITTCIQLANGPDTAPKLAYTGSKKGSLNLNFWFPLRVTQVSNKAETLGPQYRGRRNICCWDKILI